MSSQRSFQSIAGKYSDGLEVLKGLLDYNPAKEELKTASLDLLKDDAAAKNSAVVSTGTVLKDLKNSRRIISFSSREADQNCVENLMRNILSFIKAELGAKSPAYAQIYSIIKKINPPADKKEELKEGEEPKKIRSSSEKTFQSLVGFGNDVVTVLTGLGESYKPANTNITLANFKNKVEEISLLNAQIVNADVEYSAAVDAREELYCGDKGILKRIQMIKNFLASLEGGRKNAGYTAFCAAVK